MKATGRKADDNNDVVNQEEVPPVISLSTLESILDLEVGLYKLNAVDP
jgi:hypothetical protein